MFKIADSWKVSYYYSVRFWRYLIDQTSPCPAVCCTDFGPYQCLQWQKVMIILITHLCLLHSILLGRGQLHIQFSIQYSIFWPRNYFTIVLKSHLLFPILCDGNKYSRNKFIELKVHVNFLLNLSELQKFISI